MAAKPQRRSYARQVSPLQAFGSLMLGVAVFLIANALNGTL